MEEQTQHEQSLKALEEVKQKILNHPGVKQAREQYLDKVIAHLNEVLKLHFDEQDNQEKFDKIAKEMRVFIEKMHL